MNNYDVTMHYIKKSGKGIISSSNHLILHKKLFCLENFHVYSTKGVYCLTTEQPVVELHKH